MPRGRTWIRCYKLPGLSKDILLYPLPASWYGIDRTVVEKNKMTRVMFIKGEPAPGTVKIKNIKKLHESFRRLNDK